MMRKNTSWLLVVLVGICGMSAWAQTTTGTITGRLTDPSGAVVAGATVTVVNPGTGASRALTTDSSGNYTATLLLPGQYSVTSAMTGFKTEVRTGIRLEIDQTVRVDIALSLGSTSDRVEVNATALTLDTDSASIGQVIDRKQINDLPLNGRNFTTLLFLEPSAVTTGGEQSTYRYGVGDAISIGGGISASNSFTLDGTMITDTAYDTPAFAISMDAVEEFKMQEKNYSAEFGFGANQVNFSTRAGTNQFHGSVFEFIRNTALDARDWFNVKPQPVAPLKQNQFGYALGGPVWIPKIYNGKDKTFFFANYEGLRIRTQQTMTGTMPYPDELTGVFQTSEFSSNATATIVDPLTGIPFSKNANGAYVIPAGRISKLGMLAASKLFATPNVTGNSAYNYIVNAPSTVNEDQQTYRIDQVFSGRDSMFVRATISSVYVTLPALVKYSEQQQNQQTRNYQVTETHVFTPNLLNQARIGYLEAQVLRLGYIASAADAASLGLSNIFHMSDADYPVISLSTGLSQSATGSATQTLSTVGGPANFPTGSLQPAWDLSDSVSYSHGKHAFSFGFTYRDVVLDRQSTVNPLGNYTFNGTLSHNQIADLLLGNGSNAQAAQPGPISNVSTGNSVHLHFKMMAPYAADDWKVTDKLTLNLGLRYDFQTVPWEEQNHLAWFNPAGQGGLFMANQSVVQNYGGTLYTYNGMRGPGPSQKNVIAPRFGFAFRPFEKGRTVIRGGYGIYYDQFETNEFVSSTAVFPFAPTQAYPSTPGGTIYETDTLFPPLAVGPVTTATFANSLLQIAAPKKLNPYAQDFSLGVEQQLGSKMIASIEYVGNTGTHLNIRTNVNQPSQCIPATGCNPTLAANQTLAGRVARRPYKNFGQMILEDWSGFSNYNAMNLKLQRRSRDLTGTIAYSWSKMLDVKSAAAAVTGDAGGPYGFQNYYCRMCDYARSDYDVGQRIVANVVYNLPFGRGERYGTNVGRGMDLLIGGFQLNAIGSVQGGFPFTLSAADAGNGVNEATGERANLIGDPYPTGFVKNVYHWFSPLAFAEPAAGFFGNSERNYLRGPGIQTLDASVFKTLHFERVELSLRFESFNVLNHPQFANPNSSVTVQQGGTLPTNYPLGTISSTNSKVPHRENQGGVRITF
jgi:Carboxypeptidase regulatory-like domain